MKSNSPGIVKLFQDKLFQAASPTKRVNVVGGDDWVEEMFFRRGFTLCEDPRDAHVLCFTGGEDVDPRLYGERPLQGTFYNSERDRCEIAVLRMTDDLRGEGTQMAVGICRGGQFLNVMAGGRMWQDVNNHTQDHWATDLTCGNEMRAFCGNGDAKVRVTSTHHQMMRPGFGGKVIMIASESTEKVSTEDMWQDPFPDVDVEAIWYAHQNFLCFQPHPEYGNQECEDVFFEYVNWFQPRSGWA